MGAYNFTAQVRDKAGQIASRDYLLTLRERPNRSIESARLVGLIHGPERVAPAGVSKLARQMKRQGFEMGIPISYHNGDLLFRWPTAFSKKQTPTDQVAAYKQALEAEGMEFGMYFGPVDDINEKEFTLNQQVLVMQEAIERYQPKSLWLDWLGGDSASLDSLFSAIRSMDPEINIIMNGVERPSQGDWDIIAYEGWAAWGDRLTWNVWPASFPWAKKSTPLTWRLSPEPEWSEARGISAKWDEMLRVQLSVIGEGFIADIDHSASITPTKTGNLTSFRQDGRRSIRLHLAGSKANPGHSHFDKGGFTAELDGTPFLIDRGSGSSTQPRSWKDRAGTLRLHQGRFLLLTGGY